jgi:hypothetical protein
MFPRAKKRRGRPRKGTATPSSKLPSDVAVAIVALAADKALWAAAKERARQKLTLDRNRVPGVARDLGVFLLDKINRETGFDTRSNETIARELGVDRRAAIRAHKQLASAGHTLRTVAIEVGRGRVSKTTLPMLLVAAAEVTRERSSVVTKNSAGVVTENSAGGDKKIPKVVTKKSRRWCQKNPRRGDKQTTQTLIGTPVLNPSAGAREATPALDEVSKSASPDAAPRYRPNWADLKAAISGKTPRFDRTRPMRERISLWQFGAPTDPADIECRRLMLDLAKGQDLAALRDQFCRWIESPGRTAPRDAQEAFLAWLASTSAKRGSRRTSPAAQENDLGASVERVWAEEDQQDAPQRAPFEAIGKRLLRRPLGRVSAELIAKVKRGRK